jgi:tetratricopeptide (TPR) repeat protein
MTPSEQAEKLRDSQVDMLLKIALIRKEGGNEQEALKRVKEAAALDLESTASRVLVLGNTARESKAFYYSLALEQYREAKNPEGEAKTLVLIGRTYVSAAGANPEDKEKEYEKAIEYFQNGLKLYERVGNNADTVNVWWSIGSAYSQLQNFEQSVAAYRQALEIAAMNKDKRLQGRALYYIATNEEKQGLKDKAIESYMRAQLLATETKDFTFELGAARAIARLKGSASPSPTPSPRPTPSLNPAPGPESEGALLSAVPEASRYRTGNSATFRLDELIFALRPCQSDRLCLYFNSSTFDFGSKAMFSDAWQ